MLLQGLEVALDILHQSGKGITLMVVRDFPSRPPPEPLDPVRVRVVGLKSGHFLQSDE